MQYEVIQINENTWRIEDQGVRFFLLTGSELSGKPMNLFGNDIHAFDAGCATFLCE